MKGVLYLQSSYSMLKNMIPLEDLFKEASNYGYEFLALSDEQLHGANSLFKNAIKYNMKPILGMTLEITNPEPSFYLIYVKNQEGYKNLLALSLLKSQKHTFSMEDLVIRQKGLIIVTGGYKSLLDQVILYKDLDYNYLDKLVSNYKNTFDDFYLGLSLNHDIQANVSTSIINELSIRNNIKILPVHQTSYLSYDDREVFEALIKIENESNKIDIDANYKMLSLSEIETLFSKYDSMKSNLDYFLNSITFNLIEPKYELPIFPIKDGIDPKEYLVSLAKVGLRRRLELNNIKDHQPYIKRLDHELEVIINMNFENYFLIVYDFIKYAKSNDVLVGPGRGSAAGSLVSYCLGITNVDPISYGLLFERFLNPQRMSYPDIDIDFPDNKRDFVIDYVANKYGIEHICSISTYSTFALRSSIRDIARVLSINPNRVTGIIESVISGKIDPTDTEVAKVVKISNKIEGLYRQTGTHAAGIILSKQNLIETMPLQTGSFDFYQSQYDASTLEALGLNKIDFLGIRNLTIIDDILNYLKSIDIFVDLNNIKLDDKLTYELLSKGDTTGLFQLESPGMRKVLEKLKPNTFEDIVATLALYRPGPMANIDIYISRRNGAKFNYYHKDLEPILKPTYGIIIYQEQIMQIATSFAGYNLFEADMLRVGVSKKDKDILEKERIKFVEGAMKKKYSNSLANQIYDYIVKFADYGFNRSHSVSYGIISYQMAYLKANYYSVFMKVLLDHVIGNTTQTRSYIIEAINNGLTVSKPDINISGTKYLIKGNELIMPLNAIKGIGVKLVNDIELEREKAPFNDYNNIKERLASIINETQLKNLIYAGALDHLNMNRKTLASNTDLSNVGYENFIKDFKISEVEDYTFNENFDLEFGALGFNLTFDMTKLIDELNPNKKKYLQVSHIPLKSNTVFLIGFINSIKEYTDSSNNTMCFITITDGLTNIDVTIFSSTYLEVKEFINDKLSIFQVKRNTYKGKENFILEKVSNLNV